MKYGIVNGFTISQKSKNGNEKGTDLFSAGKVPKIIPSLFYSRPGKR